MKIILSNPDAMPHNIVFFQPGTDVVAACNKQMEQPDEARKLNWLPEDPALVALENAEPERKEEFGFEGAAVSRASILSPAPCRGTP